MLSVRVIQHVDCETLGTIADVLEGAEIPYRYIRPFAGNPVPPDISDSAGLIVMGGPMGVYEKDSYPFLIEEMRLIEKTLHAEKPVLGICLGSQLLAATLGAPVAKGERKEIGWFPVSLSDSCSNDPLWTGIDSPFVAYHWHGDIFDLPNGAVSLASSAITKHQAFRYGRNAYGFLFHMEVTPTIIHDIVENFTDELREAKVDGEEILRNTTNYLPSLQSTGRLVFRRWGSLIEKNIS